MSNLREPSGDFGALMEVRLLRWGESSTAGRTITLELHPDEGESHPFKAFKSGKDGQRFWMVFRPIADDETPVPASRHEVGERPLSVTRPVQQRVIHTPDSGEESVLDASARDPTQPNCGPKVPRDLYTMKTRRSWHSIAPSERAAILCADPKFRDWISDNFNLAILDPEDAADWLRGHLGIKSRAELTMNDAARRAYEEIDHAYRVANGLEHEAR